MSIFFMVETVIKHADVNVQCPELVFNTADYLETSIPSKTHLKLELSQVISCIWSRTLYNHCDDVRRKSDDAQFSDIITLSETSTVV